MANNSENMLKEKAKKRNRQFQPRFVVPYKNEDVNNELLIPVGKSRFYIDGDFIFEWIRDLDI